MPTVASTGLSWLPSQAPTSRSGIHYETTPVWFSDDAGAPELRPLAEAAAIHPIALVQHAAGKVSGHCRWWPAGAARPPFYHYWRTWPAWARAPVLLSAMTIEHLRMPVGTTTVQVT
jgi:hypothetical protein